MDSEPTREISTGLFVLLGFAALFFLATQTTNLRSAVDGDAYEVIARFDDVSGLRVRAPVTMAGVTIGRVERIELDNQRLDAAVTLRIRSDYNQIPEDSDARILTAGLLGSKYVGIGAGGAEEVLGDRDEIQLTQSAVVLESLISKLLFSLGGKE